MSAIISWTLTNGSTTKSFAEWNCKKPTRIRANRRVGKVILETSELFDGVGQFAQGSTIIINQVSTDSVTLVATSTQWFVGRVEMPARRASPGSESISYTLVDAWWYLEQIVYQIYWKERSTPTDPNSALVNKYKSSIFLNKDINDQPLTVGQQITDALQYCLDYLAENAITAPFQIGTIDIPMNIPVNKVVDVTCAQVIENQLRYCPDAVTKIDYETTPPTIHILRQAQLTPVTQNCAGKPVESIEITPRYDLQRPSVSVKFEVTDTSNGIQLPYTVEQIAPPGATGREFRTATATINLEGFTNTRTAVRLERLLIDAANADEATRIAWWKLKHPDLAQASISNLHITQSTRVNPTYLYELVSGGIAPWMNANAAREDIKATATYDQVVGGKTYKKLSNEIHIELNVTDATRNDYSTNTGNLGDEIPADFATNFFAGVSFLYWDGSRTFVEKELTSPIDMGNTLNLSGGRAEWLTMNSAVQQITEDMEEGRTTVEFGPPNHLGIAEMAELLKFNSRRFCWGSNAGRAAGTSSNGGTVNVPGKNSVANSTKGEAVVSAQQFIDPANAANIINLDPTLCGGKELKPMSIADLCIGNTLYTLTFIGKLTAQ
jgi:hypothetical protein